MKRKKEPNDGTVSVHSSLLQARERVRVLQILANVAKRLEELHAAGYVHRDLKPANVMWLPRENLWTLIDFGCAAKIGSRANLSFTLSYAAPETVKAVKRHAPNILVSPAVDAWALGVMMYELLTGQKAFERICDGHAVVRLIVTYVNLFQ
jgi:eukaryotic-like serine/threonine-protein kinase